MLLKRTGLVLLALTAFLLAGDARAQIRDHSQRSRQARADKEKPTTGVEALKPFKTLVKDRVAIEGLFTFYHDTTDNSMLMSVKPEQLGVVYLCGETRVQADGSFYDNNSQQDSYPFYLQRVGNRIMMLEKNLRLRADSTNPIAGALKATLPDQLVGATEVKSLPHDSTKAVLIDPAELFIKDANNIGYFLGQLGRTGVTYDAKNSYFREVKSFPENTEISVRLHYRTAQPLTGTTMQNAYGFFHTYHYSLSTLPKTDYIPRYADDRVGHFTTFWQDYTKLDRESPYIWYVDRWNLKKKNPEARISEPVEPIVFWVDKNTPPEYRDAVAEGIEFWNPCFEAVGFRNAVIAKQMEDTASWDPADVRYNTVIWMVQPGGTYAVGPHRANPFTGQIYDADIRLSTDWIRIMFTTAQNWVGPLQPDGTTPDGSDPFFPKPPATAAPEEATRNPHACDYQREAALEASFGLNYLVSSGVFADKDSLTREYVHAYIVEVVAHEVGHTLGLRHNFKGSTVYTFEQLSDREFTRKNSTTGSIMDYGPPNLAPLGLKQGEFFASVPGPYDFWAIEYAYSDLGAKTPEEEQPKLDEIASRGASDPRLAYATDEDVFGYTLKSIDPKVNQHDVGSDPLEFAKSQVAFTKKLWLEAIKEFEKPGTRWQKIYQVFQIGWRGMSNAARLAPKYVGGIDHARSHIGDPGARVPFQPVPAEKQREAVQLLRDNLFAPDAFDLPADLVNKLESEHMDDFFGSAYYGRTQVDYPLHQAVLNVQNSALANLYDPYVLNRLVNNLERVEPNEPKYTMYDMFSDVRRAIWGELLTPDNVNSFRRQLQLAHLSRLAYIYISATSIFPADARTLAANDLEILENAARRAIQATNIDEMSRAHFKEVLRQIEATKDAKRLYLSI